MIPSKARIAGCGTGTFLPSPGLTAAAELVKERLPGPATSAEPGYPGVVELMRFRSRMPLVAFILLAVVCLLLIGFVCACLSDHPAQAVERALALGGALPPLVVVWALLTALTLPRLSVAVSVVAMGRSSPLLTQRFRF
jgi:hypothetical protein